MAFIDERFSSSIVDPRLSWSNPPKQLALGEAGLSLETAADTDLWQRTHYGFRRDNAHALTAAVEGDFELETSVAFEPLHQYDQAGLLVWLSAECWLKTSIEFELEGPSRLGSVVTNGAWSDWATQDIPNSTREGRYRITRTAGDYIIQYCRADEQWTHLRMAHLHADDGSRPVRAGIYACSPKSGGFKATFRCLRILDAP